MEVVNAMVSKLGFDPNIPRISDGCTPLHLAIWFKYQEMAGLLIYFGADPKVTNFYGEACGEKYKMFVETCGSLLDADTIEALLCNYCA